MNKKSLCFILLKQPWREDPYSDPSLGLLSVIATAKNIRLNGKTLDISLLDMSHEKDIPKSDIYAASACTLDYPELLNVANRIKSQGDGKVIAGGPHFDVFPASYWEGKIKELPMDVICRGEGEATISPAIESVNQAKKTKRVITQDSQLLKLDSLPLPAREFLDREHYFKPGKVFSGKTFKQGNSTTAMMSRGCPFNCSFCASPELHKRKVRYRSVDNVKKEVELLQEGYGITEIRFQDDCFTLNKKRFKELSETLSKTGIIYRCSMRTDQVNEEDIELLWLSGCREIGFGIESAENAILKLLNKKTTVVQNESALRMAKEKGFRVRAFIMTGLPGETESSADYMIDFLEKTKPDVVTLTSFIPLPGCDIYNHPEDYGVRIIDEDWSKYDIALKWESKVPFVHTLSTIIPEKMEVNREKLKVYLFNRGMSNVKKYNTPYNSDTIKE